MGVGRGGAERRQQRGVGGQRRRRAERPAGAVVGDRGLREDQVAEAKLRCQRAAGADADEPASAEPDQLLGDDRRARTAHARRLDGQQFAVGGRAGIAPEAAVVVEHARLSRELLGQTERATGVSGQQDALGDGRVRAQVNGL
jgi:hypothetical protein